MSSAIAITAADFEKEVLQSDKLVIVDFWAQWCGPCKMIAPLLDEIARENPDTVKIVKVDVDAEDALAKQHEIFNIPSMLFFKGGQVKDRVVGTASKKTLTEKITANA